MQHPKPELDPDRRGLKLSIRDIVSNGLLHPGLVDTVSRANSERIGHQVADGGELSTRVGYWWRVVVDDAHDMG